MRKFLVLLLLAFPVLAIAEADAIPKPLSLLSAPEVVAVCVVILNVSADSDATEPAARAVNSNMTKLLMLREAWVASSPQVLPVADISALNDRVLAQPSKDLMEQHAYCLERAARMVNALPESKKLLLLSRAMDYRDRTLDTKGK